MLYHVPSYHIILYNFAVYYTMVCYTILYYTMLCYAWLYIQYERTCLCMYACVFHSWKLWAAPRVPVRRKASEDAWGRFRGAQMCLMLLGISPGLMCFLLFFVCMCCFFVCLFVCLLACLFVCLFVCLVVCVFVFVFCLFLFLFLFCLFSFGGGWGRVGGGRKNHLRPLTLGMSMWVMQGVQKRTSWFPCRLLVGVLAASLSAQCLKPPPNNSWELSSYVGSPGIRFLGPMAKCRAFRALKMAARKKGGYLNGYGCGCQSRFGWSHFGVGAPPILEPILMVGLGGHMGQKKPRTWTAGFSLWFHLSRFLGTHSWAAAKWRPGSSAGLWQHWSSDLEPGKSWVGIL